MIGHLEIRVWMLVLLLSILGAIWSLIPTSTFVDSKSFAYLKETEQFRFEREINYDRQFGPIWGSWFQEVSSPGAGECPDEGRSHYQVVESDTVVYNVSPELMPCIPEGGQFFLSVNRSAELWRWFPIRPTSERWICSYQGGPCTRIY